MNLLFAGIGIGILIMGLFTIWLIDRRKKQEITEIRRQKWTLWYKA